MPKKISRVKQLENEVQELQEKLIDSNNLLLQAKDAFTSFQKDVKVALRLHPNHDWSRASLVDDVSSAVRRLEELTYWQNRIEGSESDTRKENTRLWYLVRVALKDPTIGEQTTQPDIGVEHSPFWDVNKGGRL